MGALKGRLVLYCRSSTGDAQAIRSQAERLRAAAEAEGRSDYVIVHDSGSGRTMRRPGMVQVMRWVDAGVASAVWAVRLDRLSRRTLDALMLLDDWHRRGIEVRLLDHGLDTGSPMGRVAMVVLALFSELEREAIRQRTKRGLERARAAGRGLGRPRARVDLERVQALRDEGATWRQIAERLGVSVSTLRRRWRERGR